MVDLIFRIILTILSIFGGIIGIFIEKKHYQRLEEREATYCIPIVDLKTVPPGIHANDAQMVLGQVVIASDYLKTFFSKIRNIFGGEMKSFERMIERGRREALARAMDEAVQLGAVALINVRFDTSNISMSKKGKVNKPMAEVLCAATALLP